MKSYLISILLALASLLSLGSLWLQSWQSSLVACISLLCVSWLISGLFTREDVHSRLEELFSAPDDDDDEEDFPD
jgi:hypothetical protein